MLTYLSIENFTLIEFAEIEFNRGLSVITGETGAGKSILIDTIELIMGKKTDTSVIRAGCDRATLSMIFDLKQLPLAKKWLLEHELIENEDNECTITRIINRQGRQRHSINGQPVPQQKCRDLAPLLLNILGQHQAQHLLRQTDCHAWLDTYAECQKEALAVKQQYQAWADINSQIEKLKQSLTDNNARFDLLQYQVEEFNQFELTEKHLQQLNETHTRLSQFEQLQESLQQITDLLGEAERFSILQSFYQIEQLLLDNVKIDDSLSALKTCIEQAIIPTQEAFATARDYSANLSFDATEFRAIEDELSKIHALARKHRVKEDDLPALKQRIVDEFDNLERGDEKLLELESQRQRCASQYHDLAKKLSSLRTKAAKKLGQQVTQHIQQLGMPHAQLKVDCVARDKPLNPHGAESIQFMVMTNPGQPWQPLGKIASGGELSRIHLAMNVEMKQQDNCPTLICDEVDAGIGGQTSHLIGKLLAQLGQNQQVLTVTHLAPIAALGQQHFFVRKFTENKQTFSKISLLSKDEKIDEIARMLGGKDVTQQTRALAEELIANH